MIYNAVVHWNVPVDEVIEARIKKAQMVVDSEVLRYLPEYMPNDQGGLIQSMFDNTIIGSGQIITGGPECRYAHYLYEGEIYGPTVPIKENGVVVGFFSPVQPKYPTGRMMEYPSNPKTGRHWFDLMKAERCDAILRAVNNAVKDKT